MFRSPIAGLPTGGRNVGAREIFEGGIVGGNVNIQRNGRPSWKVALLTGSNRLRMHSRTV